MVRFLCFQSSVHLHKPKKTVQLSTEVVMQKSLEDRSQNKELNDFILSLGKSPEDALNSGVDNVPTPSLIENDWKSEGFKSKNDNESNVGVQRGGYMRKSMSLGSGLDRKEERASDYNSEDGSNHAYSCGSDNLIGGKNYSGHYQEAMSSLSFQVSSNVGDKNESIFLVGDDYLQSEREDSGGNSQTRFSGEEGSNHTPPSPTPSPTPTPTPTPTPSAPGMVKSSSLTNLGNCGALSDSAYRFPSSRSCDDLNDLDSRRKDKSMNEVGMMQDQERNSESNIDPKNGDSCVGSAKNWIVPVMDELNKGKNVNNHYLVCPLEELPSQDCRIKRIEKWVMDLQHCSPLEETDFPSISDSQLQTDDSVVDDLMDLKMDAKVNPGMEAAKKYISSLTASTTTAQMVNLGLVVIPFISAFVSLKALNLSGNAIVRITAGALPRGLHSLNLSKNNISTIEGLRELTRLRVLDLSYNRLLRIGHGLASCSSLKELYLAGNKISEVEGLHRLLKLNVLDLRFNKLSTTKSLGQLAANYNSLQAISLEGNPAQKNVGDDQLKKYLQSLLPHITYFNRHSIKSGPGFKDGADRSARLGVSVHQSDRGLRSDLKTMRKVNHVASTSSSHKIVSTSGHGRKSAGSRHRRLPPTSGVKTGNRGQQFHDWSSKLVNSPGELAIRKVRSEGTLGVI